MTIADAVFDPNVRPKLRCEETWKHVAKILAPKVSEWAGEEVLEGESFEDEIFQILDDAFSLDGFKLAKEFDDLGYEADLDLVEILNEVEYLAMNFKAKQEQAWVVHFGAKAKLLVGAVVKVKHRHDDQVGTIVEIDKKRGYYTVQIDALGHGVQKVGSRTVGCNYAFEEVEKWNAELQNGDTVSSTKPGASP